MSPSLNSPSADPIDKLELRTSNSQMGPSSLYGAKSWRLGLSLAKILPRSVCVPMAIILARLYWLLAPHRRQIIIDNLVPIATSHSALRPSHSELRTSKFLARRLLRNFAVKLVDLWRFEAGLAVDGLLADATGWEHFQSALAQKRGLLLLTPHLGNWEFGAPFLLRKALKLLVLTLAEPGKDFTQLRQAARARWDIETLVIGQDPFAFLDVIRRLENGATVALLVDRPPSTSSVAVNLFGRAFSASIAAAELARASNCVLLPVYMPYHRGKYYAHVLPAIDYDRAALRDREARLELTQRIITAFEPIIAQYPDQWYHFVPLWSPSTPAQ